MNVKSKRVAAAIIDMLVLPMVAGVIVGVALLNVDEMTRNNVLRLLSPFRFLIIFRDFVYSPGRHMCGLELVDMKTGIRVCCYRGNFFINLGKSIVRNILLIIPFVLVIGYIVETVMVMTKGHRLADKWAGVEVVGK